MNNMARKWRLTAWVLYTVGCFLIMLIGFDLKISISVSIIIGFICGLFNEIIHILSSIRDNFNNLNK